MQPSLFDIPRPVYQERWIVFSRSVRPGEVMYWTGNGWSENAALAQRMSEDAAMACSLARSTEMHRPYAAFCEEGKEGGI